MKAAILEKYASDGRELIVRDIPIPVIADDEVFSLDDINKALKKVAS